MKTNSKSFLNLLTVGCVLAVMLFHSAGSVHGDTEETQQNNITGTWNLSIRYTGGDVRSTYALKRVSGPAKGKDMSLSAAATNNVGEWITAHFISFRVMDPPPGNLTFTLKQEGEKVTGAFSGLGGRQKVSGTVKGEKVSLSAAVTNNVGEQITARFNGEVLSSSKMEGTVTFDPKSSFSVTGTGPKRIMTLQTPY
jgi:hypothetical protein